MKEYDSRGSKNQMHCLSPQFLGASWQPKAERSERKDSALDPAWCPFWEAFQRDPVKW
ncbi:hypothetical protein GUITHDRAFT_154371 [Guillardia theta CCMP2712]|uniref:Uncharacterized protein n=1 Tax=Guillardia theta (strain CCMP2712) TaxID=905079 RepID=L1ITE7_GUITC|nr:hypothetical protein GUITHDRAFT_154371 [Guillardia theta CCMP2712]EKX39541.1 hypothetical protein GUITHDRAFT_154371 [Guillardia theta CCMP2712]|eukprot:XP_005826521.1 hypothetical protein GUITHDRAFT_154371 [Guillardia theta CCMP2712]